MKLDIEFTALDDLAAHVDAFPTASREAARIALNDVADGEGLAILRKDVESQIAFPTGYINDERLGVTSRATDARLRTVITGRQRATSLARFARGQTPGRGKAGVSVQVKAGSSRTLPRAFLVNLKRGNADGGNIGLAVRLKPGERLRNKTDQRSVRLDDNVFLLYGPSVDQVFRDVALDDGPRVLQLVEREYYRQFFRLTARKGRR